MDASSPLESCFPELDPNTKEKLLAFEELLQSFNRKVNLVSRKEDAFMERQIIPSLFPLKVIDPPKDARVTDIGTGGGLPGIPLAIAYPRMEFHLLDSRRKKLDAIEGMCRELGIENLRTEHERLERARFQADLITGRAVMALPRFVALARKHLAECSKEKGERGILYWTGGDLKEDLKGLPEDTELFAMAEHFDLPSLESKKLVRIPYPSVPTSN
jgi:16S rRNA (guanine527-N7)-methyltransferase